MTLDRNALDRWMTGGRYSSEPLVATCSDCGERTDVKSETEYGATTWTPEECPSCGTAWDESTAYEDDERDPDEAYDRAREERSV